MCYVLLIDQIHVITCNTTSAHHGSTMGPALVVTFRFQISLWLRFGSAPASPLFLASSTPPLAMGIRGVRVTTFSPFEMRAFGDIAYEIKKKLMWHSTNLGSTWASMIPAMVGTYALVKWAEESYHHKLLHERD